jgi:hypothetical protein
MHVENRHEYADALRRGMQVAVFRDIFNINNGSVRRCNQDLLIPDGGAFRISEEIKTKQQKKKPYDRKHGQAHGRDSPGQPDTRQAHKYNRAYGIDNGIAFSGNYWILHVGLLSGTVSLCHGAGCLRDVISA